METPISISLLDNVEIATPCTARWEEMAGNERTRHCSHCSLNVYNLSAMTRDEANTLIAGSEGRLCIRLYRRDDGTVLTQDCPVGLRALRQRTVRSIRNIAATTVAVLAGMIGIGTRQASAQSRMTMGAMVRPDPTPTKDSTAAHKKVTRKKVDTKKATAKKDTVELNTVRQDTAKPEPTMVEPAYIMGGMRIVDRTVEIPAQVEPDTATPQKEPVCVPNGVPNEVPVNTVVDGPVIE